MGVWNWKVWSKRRSHAPCSTRRCAVADMASAPRHQMIADAVGITKLLSTTSSRPGSDRAGGRERELAGIPASRDARERVRAAEARDALLAGVIDMAVRDRRLVRTLPVRSREFANAFRRTRQFQHFVAALPRAGELDDDGCVAGAMLSGDQYGGDASAGCRHR